MGFDPGAGAGDVIRVERQVRGQALCRHRAEETVAAGLGGDP
jgi:hypothetical protein